MILDAFDAGDQRLKVADLLDRIEDPEIRQFITTLAIQDDGVVLENPGQILSDCVQQVKTHALRDRKRRLLSELHEAERTGDSGNVETLTREMAELHQLEAKIKMGTEINKD